MAVGTRREVLRASVLTLVVPAVVLAAVVGVAFVPASSAEGWAGLGYVLVGLAAGALLGTVALVVTASVAFRRALPAGHRLRPAAAVVAGVAVLVAVAVPVGRPPVPALAVACLLALPVLLPLAVTGHLGWRWVAAPLVAAVVLGSAQGMLDRAQVRDDRRADLAWLDGGLPLTGGRSLASPLPGWRHLLTDAPTSEHDLPLRIQWRRTDRGGHEDNYVVEATRERTDCTPLGADPTCTGLGTGPHGTLTRHSNAVTYVFVQVGDVEWRVSGLDDAESTTVLESLEAVDVDTFVSATDASPGIG